MEGQTEAKNAKLKKSELPRAKIPSKCETVFALLWENFNEMVTCLQNEFKYIIALVENLSGHGQVFTLELLLVDETVHMSQI